MRTKILFALVDYDGCAGYPTLVDIKEKNQQLYDCLLNEVEKYTRQGFQCKIVLAIGSNRQCFSIDAHSAASKGNGSCINLLPGLEAGLRDAFINRQIATININLLEFLMEDLYSNHAHGTTLRLIGGNNADRMLREHNVFDHHKITLIHTFIHMVTTQFSRADGCSTACYFFDDNEPILTCLSNFFSKHHAHLPHNNELFLMRYVRGVLFNEANRPIQGSGKPILPTLDTLFDFILQFHPSFDLNQPTQLAWNNFLYAPIQQNRVLNSPAATPPLHAEDETFDTILEHIANRKFLRALSTTKKLLNNLSGTEKKIISNQLLDSGALSNVTNSFFELIMAHQSPSPTSTTHNLFQASAIPQQKYTAKINEIITCINTCKNNMEPINLIDALPNNSVSEEEKNKIISAVETTLRHKKIAEVTIHSVKKMFTAALKSKLIPADVTASASAAAASSS